MADNFSPPRPPERPTGLASRPAPREEKKTGFMESIRSFFSREDDDTDTYVKARDKFYDDPYMAAMEDAAKRAAERRAQGVTQSRKPSAPPAEVYTPEVVEPERATEEVVADVLTGKGLMSVPRPRTRPAELTTEDPLLSDITERLVELEGFKEKAYKPVQTEKYYTIGYGHYSDAIKPGQTISQAEAEELLKEDILKRLPKIRNAFPEYDTFSRELQVELAQGWFRGDVSGSPNTRRLINEGKFEEAAREFLNNEEYKNAVKLKKPGIRTRMESISAALLAEARRR